jgi:hypothetical protein
MTAPMNQSITLKSLTSFVADLITPAEVALWKRGASNAGYVPIAACQEWGGSATPPGGR